MLRDADAFMFQLIGRGALRDCIQLPEQRLRRRHSPAGAARQQRNRSGDGVEFVTEGVGDGVLGVVVKH